MFLILFLICLLFLNLTAIVNGNRRSPDASNNVPIAGGWQTIDVNENKQDLDKLVDFALSASKPPETGAKYVIVSAEKQV